jgi:hypothetical protein
MVGRGVPHFDLQGELSAPNRRHLWVTACGHGARTGQKLRRLRDEIDARISPPVDEYYIIQYEGARSVQQQTSKIKDKAIVVASKGVLSNFSNLKVRGISRLNTFGRMRVLAKMLAHELRAQSRNIKGTSQHVMPTAWRFFTKAAMT